MSHEDELNKETIECSIGIYYTPCELITKIETRKRIDEPRSDNMSGPSGGEMYGHVLRLFGQGSLFHGMPPFPQTPIDRTVEEVPPSSNTLKMLEEHIDKLESALNDLKRIRESLIESM